MRTLLEALAECGSWDEVRRRAVEENLLGKTSEHQVKDLLSAFRRRFLKANDLPPAILVAKMMRTPAPEAAKLQVLLPYFVLTDPLVRRCYKDLVLSRLHSPDPSLDRDEVVAHLRRLEGEHPELSGWSEYLKLRWAWGFVALLRHFGLMEPHPKKGLLRLWLLPESFAFFWLWLWGEGRPLQEVEGHEVWEVLQLDGGQREDLLAEGAVRGWWDYRRAGPIVNFVPRFGGVEEWLRDGLGRGHGGT